MQIVWDEPKRLANRDKHGLDFVELTEEFFADAVVAPAERGRYVTIGRFGRGTIVVVFSVLGSEGLSVISMRPASRRERMLFA